MIHAIFNSKSSSWNLVERLVFPAPRSSYTIQSFPGELIVIPSDRGDDVPCLFLPFQHARFLMMFFHANAEDLGLVYNFCTVLRDMFQVNVLAVEYPGYGICPGTPTEAGIIANAEAAMEFATETLNVAHNDILILGRSLGTGPAISLAARYEVAGVILVSPFASIKELFERRVGRLAHLLEDRFQNLVLAPKILSATLNHSRFARCPGSTGAWSQNLCLYFAQADAGDTSKHDSQLFAVERCWEFCDANDQVFFLARLCI